MYSSAILLPHNGPESNSGILRTMIHSDTLGVLGQIYHLLKTVDFGSRALGFVTQQKRSTSLKVLRFAAFYPLSLLANLVSDFSLINWDLIQHSGNLSRILLKERG